jgi:hypothetical protein
MKYIFRTNKNPDLPIDFKNIDRKPKAQDFYAMFVIVKNKSRSLGKNSIGKT